MTTDSLAGVSLTVRRGEIVGVVTENGRQAKDLVDVLARRINPLSEPSRSTTPRSICWRSTNSAPTSLHHLMIRPSSPDPSPTTSRPPRSRAPTWPRR
ncbi:hypothetical protein GS934_07510 [Rhodococcus hoagii]|nr:hypothetical protein [Prescottella equi]NKZ87431.1 hypothetical protein [Prescottella equi]